MNLQVHGIDYRGSIVDGPGVRTVLFVQGCEKQCHGCHNRQTWDPKAGTSISVDKLAEDLRAKTRNRKLTISGGEPLLQYDSLLALLQLLHDFDIVLYTGYELDEVPKDLVPHLKYIKVGPYIHDKRTTINPYIGSTNQQFIKLQEEII